MLMILKKNNKVLIQMFKAPKQTKRFNLNQKVWITHSFANHSCIIFKYRGKGRYVRGVIDNEHLTGVNIKWVNVDYEFAERRGINWIKQESDLLKP